MGRGSSKAGGSGSGGGNPLLNSVTDNLDFKAWIKENLNNPEFKEFGKNNGMEAVKELWREKRIQAELKNIHEVSIEDAVEQVRDNVSASTMSGWFRSANSEYKPKLVDSILANPGTLNAGLNIAYNNYKNDMGDQGKTPLSFNKWLTTPQEVYRGTRGQKTIVSDVFTSYTPDKKVAAGFTLSDSGGGHNLVKPDFSNIDKSKISTVKIRPIDTLGSYQTTGELEILIPSRKLKRK